MNCFGEPINVSRREAVVDSDLSTAAYDTIQDIMPLQDKKQSLGSLTKRFANIYADNITVVTTTTVDEIKSILVTTDNCIVTSLTPSSIVQTDAESKLVTVPTSTYEKPLSFSTGLTRTFNTVAVNPTQSISKLSNLTSNGFIKTSGSDGTLSIDANTYENPLTFSSGVTRTLNNVTVDTKQNIAKLSNLTSNGFIKTSGSDGTLSIDTSTFENPLTFSTGLTRSLNTITVNNILSILKLSNLTLNGFIKTGSGDGTLSIDTSSYLTGNQTITLSGAVSGSGTTAITTSIADNSLALSKLAQIAGGSFLGKVFGSTGNVQPIQIIPSTGMGANTWLNVAGVDYLALSTVQDISTTSAPTFNGLTCNNTLNMSSQPITNCRLGSLTSNGFVKTSGGNGTLSVDTTAYLSGVTGTANQITVSGSAPSPTLSLPTSLYVNDLRIRNNTTNTIYSTLTTDAAGRLNISSGFGGSANSITTDCYQISLYTANNANVSVASSNGSKASVSLYTDPGTSTSDAFVNYAIGTTNFTTGIDQSDSSKFKISASNTLGTSDALTITTGGAVSILGSSGLTLTNGSNSASLAVDSGGIVQLTPPTSYGQVNINPVTGGGAYVMKKINLFDNGNPSTDIRFCGFGISQITRGYDSAVINCFHERVNASGWEKVWQSGNTGGTGAPLELMRLGGNAQGLAIGTDTYTKRLTINSATGDCIRMQYNTPTGTATTYVDMLCRSDGKLQLVPSGGTVYTQAHCAPMSDNTYTSGGSGVRWSNVYSYGGDFAGTITGTAGITISTPSASGNSIQGPGSSTACNGIIGFTSGVSPTAGNIYGITVDRSGTDVLMMGINKNTTTGSVPANACFISSYQTGSTLTLGRGNGANLPSSTDIVINSNGSVTRPNTPSFNAYLAALSAVQTGDGTTYTIPFDTEQHDAGSNHNAAAGAGQGTFTAPVAGRYMLSANVTISALSNTHTSGVFSFLLNGATAIARVQNNPWAGAQGVSGSGIYTYTLNTVYQLAANDAVTVTVQVSGGTKTVKINGTQSNTYWFGNLLS